jgi:hypothetical protein
MSLLLLLIEGTGGRAVSKKAPDSAARPGPRQTGDRQAAGLGARASS